MSKLDELMARLCPDGVEFKTLGEIGYFFSGLNGKNKNDFTPDANAFFVPYMNVYQNLSVNLEQLQRVQINDGERQNILQMGDILFTGSSETREECGISSVVTSAPEQNLYLNSFCFAFRLNDKNLLLPGFSKYIFSQTSLRKQIIKTANGVTRFNVSKSKMEKVKIPVPPLEIQSEIVRILDNFTELTAELSAELTARKKQYEYYRDLLLNFGGGRQIEWKTLGEICKISSGGTPDRTNKNYYNGQIPWLRTQEVNFCEIKDTEIKISYDALKNSSAKLIPANCVIIAMYGATVGKSAYNSIPITTNQACCNLEVNSQIANYKYIFYWVASKYAYIKSLGQGTQTNINANIVRQIKIPVPPIEEQERIVKILDSFDKLCNDLTEGLPAEIAARKKQYEYYRDKLLTFKEK